MVQIQQDKGLGVGEVGKALNLAGFPFFPLRSRWNDKVGPDGAASQPKGKHFSSSAEASGTVNLTSPLPRLDQLAKWERAVRIPHSSLFVTSPSSFTPRHV